MKQLARWLGQGLAFAGFAAFIGWFSANPVYERFGADEALVTVSFSHTGPRESPCRRLTQEEIAALAANMRVTERCPRGRLPLIVAVEVDGERVYADALVPHGIARDGASTAYEQFRLPAGKHRIAARLRDTRRDDDGFDHERTEQVDLQPGQHFTIDFRPEAGGFVFR